MIGNPLSYNNGTAFTFTWQNGRQLASLTKGTTNVSYKYNADGIRYEKTVNGVVHKYFLMGSTITAETIVSGNTATKLEYFYDDTGAYAFTYNGTMYYYVKNLQGDVTQIRDASNNLVVSYVYDAWGKLMSTTGSLASTVGAVNPICYRGYYYDTETGFYATGTRYYDPEIGRFISPEPNVDNGEFDEGSEILGYNVYAYCFNNPVNSFDPDGEAVANIVGGIIGGAVGATLGYLLAKQLGLTGWKKWALISAATIGGAALGALLGPYVAKFGAKIGAQLGIRSIPKMGSQIGRLGRLVKNTRPTINGLTRHGLQRMAQRGVSESLARSIVRSGTAIAQSGGKTLFFTQAGAVVLNKAGEIVTAYSSGYFDSAMREIVKQFYR